MFTEARKLHIIEAVLKTDNTATLEAIETIVDSETVIAKKKKIKFDKLLGTLTPSEAKAMKKTIAENFEKINPDDWK